MEIIKNQTYYFASDLNKGTIIYSDTFGDIHIIDQNNILRNIEADSYKKYLKFYPPDTYVYTSTDIKGLRVWDANLGKQIFKYREEKLYDHVYSDKCILTSFDDYNIKFYDLRCRYQIKSISKGIIKNIAWVGNFLYTYDGDVLLKYDSRSSDEPLKRFYGINDFATTNEQIFITKIEGCIKYLGMITEKDDIVFKQTKYDRIFNGKANKFIVGLIDNDIFIEEKESIWKFPLKDKITSFEALFIDENKGYCFFNNSLVKISLENEHYPIKYAN